MKKRIIAIDFDGTITLDSPYPITGDLNPKAKKYLDLLAEKDYDLILWTARKDADFDAAVKLIKQWNLPIRIDESNVNLRRSSAKIFADFYVDDRAFMGKFNWKAVYRYIIKNVKNSK